MVRSAMSTAFRRPVDPLRMTSFPVSHVSKGRHSPRSGQAGIRLRMTSAYGRPVGAELARSAAEGSLGYDETAASEPLLAGMGRSCWV